MGSSRTEEGLTQAKFLADPVKALGKAHRGHLSTGGTPKEQRDTKHLRYFGRGGVLT